MAQRNAFMWVNKTANSTSLSRSDGTERVQIFSQAQRTVRESRKKTLRLSPNPQGEAEDEAKEQPVQVIAASAENALLKPDNAMIHLRCSPGLAITPCLTTYDATWKWEERRALQFFSLHTVSKIYHMQRDRELWVRQVPYMALTHPIIRHLMASIAATHEFLMDRSRVCANVWAMQQCDKALLLLRTSSDQSLSLLILSCILVSAYSLLRCDCFGSETTLESGLRLANWRLNQRNHSRHYIAEPLSDIDVFALLAYLRRRSALKFWTADLAFASEKAADPESPMEIETDVTHGPYTSVDQLYKGFKDMMVHTVGRLVRNLTRGAHIATDCSLAHATVQKLDILSGSCQTLSRQLPVQTADTLAIKHLRVGINFVRLLLYNKIANPVESFFDSQMELCQETLDLADDILNQIYTVQLNEAHTDYAQMLFNGSLFAIGVGSQSAALRDQVVTLLLRQVFLLLGQACHKADGLIPWIRATFLRTIQSMEAYIVSLWGWDVSDLKPQWMKPINVAYNHVTHSMKIESTIGRDDTKLWTFEHPINVYEWPGPPLCAADIDTCLDGVVTAYRAYHKPHALQTGRGSIREMSHRGAHVPVHWGDSPCSCTPFRYCPSFRAEEYHSN